MVASKLAAALAKEAHVMHGGRGDAFVLLPLKRYEQLRNALEDVLDLLELQQARAEQTEQKGVPLADYMKKNPLPKKRTKVRSTLRSGRAGRPSAK